MHKFNKRKGDLLQAWLEMSADDLKKQCKRLRLEVSDKQSDNV
jgi:Trm5-related predicted tRNA methylase